MCSVCFPECAGLVDRETVHQLHDYYLDLFSYAVHQNHGEDHTKILVDIFQLLPMLIPISAESACIMNFSVDCPPGWIACCSLEFSAIKAPITNLCPMLIHRHSEPITPGGGAKLGR